MGGAKPWQIVLIVVALLGAAGSVVYSCSAMGSPVSQASKARMVDIRTGELFEAPYPDKRPVFFPAKNPKTGEATLYPVAFGDNKWLLDRRYMADIRKDQQLKADLIVDAKTGEVRATSSKPTSADIFGK